MCDQKEHNRPTPNIKRTEEEEAAFNREEENKMGRPTTDDDSDDDDEEESPSLSLAARSPRAKKKEEKTKKKGIVVNFESGIVSLPSPNWYSSTHATVGVVKGAYVGRVKDEEDANDAEEDEGVRVLAYCAKNNIALVDAETSAMLGQISTGHQKRLASATFVESWFDFDRDGDNEKEKEEEEKDLFLLLTTSSDDAIRVHDVRAKKCVGKISTLCSSSSTKVNKSTEESSTSSRYSAKKQQQSRCGHRKGVEVCVVEREKRERGSFITGDRDGVMCMWRLAEHTRDGTSNNNNNIAINIEPEFTHAFAESMSGITALASMD